MTALATEPAPVEGDRGTEELVFSAWSAVSPFGQAARDFAEGLHTGAGAVAPYDAESSGLGPGPYERAALVPDFTPAGALGKKGTRSMDRVTALAVSVFSQLLEECGDGVLGEQPERTGLVLGTGSGSVQSIMDFTRDSLTGDRPYLVDPARFPNTVMNRAAGQSAIWRGIKGPNTTIAGGWLTGLLALRYAARLYRGGHCERVLCGAAEEFSAQRAWLEWHAAGLEAEGTGGRRPPLGEGGAAWLLEPAAGAEAAGRAPLARLAGTRFRAYHAPVEAGDALTVCVRGLLDAAGADGADVRLVAPLSGAAGDAGAGHVEEAEEVEEAAVREALPEGAAPQWLRCRPLIGDTAAAATGFQLTAVLAAAAEGRLPRGTYALVTGIDRDGTVGAALLGG